MKDASFKGVKFFVRSSDLKVGRRTVTHEYPFRDTPYVEDLGKSIRVFTFDAFFLGDDYEAQAKKLIDVLEEKGEGKLEHPFLGSLICTCTDRGGVSINEQKRIATISLTLTETGSLDFPISSQATDYLSKLSADSFLSKVQDYANSALTMPSAITDLNINIDSVTNGITDAITAAQDVLINQSFVTDLGIKDNILSLTDLNSSMQILKAQDLTEHLTSNLSVIEKANEIHNWRNNCISVSMCTDDLKNIDSNYYENTQNSRSIVSSVSNVPIDDTNKIIQKNTNVIRSIVRMTLLAQTVGMSSLIGTKTDTTISKEPPKAAVRTDVLSVRDYLITALNNEEAQQENYNVLCEIRKARSAVWNDLTYRAEKANMLYTKDLKTSLPAIVLSYREYGTVNKEQEIIERNNIKNPLFVNGKIQLVRS